MQAAASAANTKEVPISLWYKTDLIRYSIGGERDVLLIVPEQSCSHASDMAVARRPGHLTQEDKQKLLSQGVSPTGQDEVAILKARYKLDRKKTIVGVKSGQQSREGVLKSIEHFLSTTQKDGGMAFTVQLATYTLII